MDTTAILLILAALVLGAVAGWFFGSRPIADLRERMAARDGEARELEERAKTAETDFKRAGAELGQAQIELATMSERAARADDLATKLDLTREELTALKAREAGFEEQKRLLEESRSSLLTEFENTGAKVLGAAQEKFLERAAERLGHSEDSSAEKIKALLQPVGDRLEKYEKQVVELEEKRTDAFSRLYQQMTEMQRGQEQVRVEAERLGSSLRSAPKASGRWGEMQVKNVLEKCGLSERYDFVAEKSVETDHGRLRPDFVVDIPGGKKVIIDAKNIWRSYDASLNIDSESEKERLLKEHASILRGHIKALSQKSYASEFEGSSDYVVLFIPGEHLLYAALERDENLWNFAFESSVLLATPTNLVAICRTVATVWQHEGLAQNAREIGKIGSNLYDSLAKTQEDVVKMGNALNTAVARYNDFTTTYDSSVLSRARMLREKDIALKKREVSETINHLEINPQLPKKVTD